ELLVATYSILSRKELDGTPAKREDLIEAVKERYGVDPATFSPKMQRKKVANLTEGLDERLVGQHQAKKSIVDSWKRKISGVGDPDQVNSTLFAGPPGTGKTTVAITAAERM